jgi:hypothetical protein
MNTKSNETAPRCSEEQLVGHLDLMRDEFIRIRACPCADSEIKGLCDRAISGIERTVPLTVEAERLAEQAESWRQKYIEERGRHMATMKVLEWTEPQTAALLDAVSAMRDFVEGRRHDSENIAAMLNAVLPNTSVTGASRGGVP